MDSKFYFTPLVTALALVSATTAYAAKPLILQDTAFATVQNQFGFAIPGTKPLYKSSQQAKNSLQFLSENVDARQVAHIRMQQNYLGFPVHRGYAIFHSAKQAQGLLAKANPVEMNGTLFSGLENELGPQASDFVSKGAKALAEFKAKFDSSIISEEKVVPMIYMDKENKAHWAYQVSVLVTYKDKTPERPTAIVDAETFKPFISWNNIKTKKAAAKGMGYGGNKKTGQFDYNDSHLPYLEITRDKKTSKCYMETTDVKVIDMKSRTTGTKTMSFDCEENAAGVYMTGYDANGYDKKNGAFSPSNDALYSGYVIKHMYHDWYGLQALESDGKPMQLVMRVHYGSSYENAFWDGRQMTFGDGARMMYPLVSLGVAAHEISHGFTEQHSDLQYYDQSGGMNEAFSDMAAQAAEYYSVQANNWMIGSEIMKESSGWEALRFMDVPSKDGSSIDTADEYTDWLDVHYSSGVYNRLFYLIATTPGWNTRTAFDIMVKANVNYWTPNSTFIEGACGILNATLDEKRSIDDVKAALDKVKIDYGTCKLKPVPIPGV